MAPKVTKVWATPTWCSRPEDAHQPHRKRRGDEGAAAEAHDGHAGRHAGAVREPFDQRRDRRDVADAERDAAEHAVAEIDDPEIVDVDAERGDEEAAGPAQGGGEHRLARPAFLDPAAEHGRRDAEKENRDGEDPAQLRELPVVRRRLRDADQLGHRQVEHAEGVGLADAQMHAQGGRRHHPPAEARFGDGIVRDRESSLGGPLRLQIFVKRVFQTAIACSHPGFSLTVARAIDGINERSPIVR